MQVERRRCVAGATSASKAKVSMEDLRSLPPIVLQSPPFPADVAGCSGVSISGLLGKATAGIGVLAGDTETDKIDYGDLAQGVLLHTGADGEPLDPAMGGPLRATFPAGVALQEDEGDGAGPQPAD
eukprot:4392997-Prymnesium_polylepis.1